MGSPSGRRYFLFLELQHQPRSEIRKERKNWAQLPLWPLLSPQSPRGPSPSLLRGLSHQGEQGRPLPRGRRRRC